MTRRFHALTVAALAVAIALWGGGRAEGGPNNCLAQVGNAEITTFCEVPAGWTSPAYGIITIKNGGTLSFPDGAGVTSFKANSIIVEDGGKMQAGTKDNPIGKTAGGGLVITFTGSPTDTPCDGEWCGKGIHVKKGGSLLLYGAKGVPANGVSWTFLSAAAGPTVAGAKVQSKGASSLTLAASVSGDNGSAWRKGDWIAVATTTFSPFETEFVQLSEDASGTSVKLSQALRNYHFGSEDPGPPSATNYLADKTKNYGVDERAEVGLITRSIRLTAEVAADSNWGGEIKIVGFNDTNTVVIQGVELEKFGKARLGSYPIHLHMIGKVPADRLTINANSIHHSYNKCITIHSTSDVTIQNNVCVRVAGHIFYQEIGDEFNITYKGNLGLGAGSHSFGITASDDRRATYWGGDNLANDPARPGFPNAAYGYSGLNIPNTDSQKNPVRGTCAKPINGELQILSGKVPFTPENGNKECAADTYYFEPPSGFWIINPTTVLQDNSIGGCQGVGTAYWYVLPRNRPDAGVPAELTGLKYTKLGTFKNNRAHACWEGVYQESQYEVFSDQPSPTADGQPGSKPVFNVFEGLTATRIRDRGAWIRPTWNVLRHGRFATNKASVILVTSGGLDGNAPGVWDLLEQSVLVGISENNVERWGPCPVNSTKGSGCVDLTQDAKDIVADGYPLPAFNLLGYQIYDGPVRILKNRFVNFNRDVTADLTDDDKKFLSTYNQYFPNPPKAKYEGDAALGWFKANQSAYPNATITNELTFENTTLRHQIFTEGVNFGKFEDGDRNTVVIDGDGSLTGLLAVDASGKQALGAVSLNNLGYNQAGPNSVDECLAEGQQDTDVEGRPTALMSPHGIATLEFQGNFPTGRKPPVSPVQPAFKQTLTFTKDSKDFCDSGGPCTHQTMALTSRNTLGVWEPKVASGYGYTVTASPCTAADCTPPGCTDADCLPAPAKAGIPKRVSVGLTDAIKPVISKTDPFRIRLGICYTGTNGSPPDANFTITRGYRSWAGGPYEPNDPALTQFFNKLVNRYPKDATQYCQNLDQQSPCVNEDGPPRRTVCEVLDPVKGCPANGVTALPESGNCPAGTTKDQDAFDRDACIYPKKPLQALSCGGSAPADCLKKLTDDTYFYDKASGMLYINMVQDVPNAHGPSPLGSCPGDAACPEQSESYYACPAQGCTEYVIVLNDPDNKYVPGPSMCQPYEQFAQDEPTSPYKLVGRGKKKDDKTFETFEIARKFSSGKGGNFPHYQLTRASNGKLLQCKATTGPDDIQLVDQDTVATEPVDGGPVSDGGNVGGGPVGDGPTDGGQVDVGPSDTGG